MELKTDRLILRDLKVSDAKNIAKYANNINVSKYLLVVPYPYRLKDAKQFIRGCLKKQKEKQRSSYEFGIVLKEDNNLIGLIGLSKIDRFQGTATIGYWLGEPYWGKGIMSEALGKVIEFSFNKVKLRRINIEAFTGNEASNALIKKYGFTYEGKRIKFRRVKATGKIQDAYVYGLLKEDWAKQKRKNNNT